MATQGFYEGAEEGKALAKEQTRSSKNYVSPAVDILETENGLTLMADIPGVSRENLEIGVEQGILTIKGTVPKNQREEIYREFALTTYYRQFQLPDEIDQEKASAEVRNGVLTLHLPKAEAAKPRRIEISVG